MHLLVAGGGWSGGAYGRNGARGADWNFPADALCRIETPPVESCFHRALRVRRTWRPMRWDPRCFRGAPTRSAPCGYCAAGRAKIRWSWRATARPTTMHDLSGTRWFVWSPVEAQCILSRHHPGRTLLAVLGDTMSWHSKHFYKFLIACPTRLIFFLRSLKPLCKGKLFFSWTNVPSGAAWRGTAN